MSKILVLYVLFALVSTGVNLFSQYVAFAVLNGLGGIYIPLFIGTAAGLAAKYLMDKKWIFEYEHTSHKDNIHKFGLYSLMGVFTTIIFWGTEMAFYWGVSFEGSQYVGGALGLAIGYVVKYYLDKKYVFKVAQ